MPAGVIREAVANYEARLASWEGGNMRNAIPREAHAVITIPAENEKELLGLVKYCEDLFNEEYSAIDQFHGGTCGTSGW